MSSIVHLDHPGALTPYERCVEVVTGLILTLSVAGSVSVISNDFEGRSALLGAILGCNVAWGAVDAALYLISQRLQRGRTALLIAAIASSPAEHGRQLLGGLLPDPVTAEMTADELEALRKRLALVRPRSTKVSAADMRGALTVFLDVVIGSLPVAFPFVIPLPARAAVHLSYAIALVMLLGLGVVMGRYAGINLWRSAGVLVGLGAALVAVVILLGG
jgi:VIT1/CCC1 family predicted Fe2+/Mn2+ transporter